MAILDVDLSTVDQLPPPGDYPIETVHAELSVSSNDKPMVKVRHKINDGGEFDGKQLFDQFSLVPEALFNMKRYVVAIGGDPEEKPDTDDWIGAQCIARVVHDEYQGVMRAKIAMYLRLP